MLHASFRSSLRPTIAADFNAHMSTNSLATRYAFPHKGSFGRNCLRPVAFARADRVHADQSFAPPGAMIKDAAEAIVGIARRLYVEAVSRLAARDVGYCVGGAPRRRRVNLHQQTIGGGHNMVEDAVCAISLTLGRRKTLTGRRTQTWTGRRTKHCPGGVRQSESHHHARTQCCARSKAGHEEISRPGIPLGKQPNSLHSLTCNSHLYVLHCLCCDMLQLWYTVGNLTMHLVASLRASATVYVTKNGPTSGVLLMASATSHMMVYIEECGIPNLAATSRDPPRAFAGLLPGGFPSRHQLPATQTCVRAEAAATKTVLVQLRYHPLQQYYSCRCPACRNALILRW